LHTSNAALVKVTYKPSAIRSEKQTNPNARNMEDIRKQASMLPWSVRMERMLVGGGAHGKIWLIGRGGLGKKRMERAFIW